jgi:glycosyltransferase involved in cell wall biosynthesis
LPGLALLFDCRPQSRTSREDQHIAVCRALRAEGVQPLIVFSRIAADIRSAYEDMGAVVEELNYHRDLLAYSRRLNELFRQHEVDTVDIEFFNYYDPIAWISRLNGVKNIVFTESNSGIYRARSWKAALIRARAALVTAPVTRGVAISHFIRGQMLRLGFPAEHTHVIHKGIDPRRYQPDPAARGRLVQQYNIRPGEIILGTASIMRTFKHPETILQACAALHSRNVPFRLFMMGNGELVPELQSMASLLGIGDRLHWLGYSAHPEEHMRGWDVFLLASEGEAFGFVLIEAMSCGVPVIGTSSGAIPEIVDHGRSGLLVPLLDSAAMADAIESLAGDESRRLAMAAASTARVKDHFHVDSAVAKTMAVYESMWARPKAQAALT